MHFGPTDAQERFRARVRAFLGEVSPPSEVRRLMEDDLGHDPGVWAAIGDFGLLDPELGWVERAIVLEEAGAVLLCAPYLSTVAATGFLPSGGRPGIATLAVAEGSGRWEAAAVETRAGGPPWRLDGVKSFVVDGATAGTIVVAARRDDTGNVALFQVDAGGPGVDREPLPTVDRTRRQARITLAAAPARLLGGSVDSAVDLCAVALAAEQVGGAQRCLDMAVDHACRRVQFGRPIGSFQAVKHLCADMLLDLESARSAAFYAASAAARGAADLPAAASVAKSCCSEAYVRVAADSLHVHGGLGFTWDHDSHLYFKRARSSQLLFGDPRHHRERLARQLGL